jgi:hypothetical protein
MATINCSERIVDHPLWDFIFSELSLFTQRDERLQRPCFMGSSMNISPGRRFTNLHEKNPTEEFLPCDILQELKLRKHVLPVSSVIAI